MSPTRRQVIEAGLPFCSLQATTQHLQPMQAAMSKPKRYCPPGPGTRSGMRIVPAAAADVVVAAPVAGSDAGSDDDSEDALRRVFGMSTNRSPSTVARSSSGSATLVANTTPQCNDVAVASQRVARSSAAARRGAVKEVVIDARGTGRRARCARLYEERAVRQVRITRGDVARGT